MAFGGFDSGASTSRVQSEINMVPLIDVMLVLLVIFIVTAPLLTHAVKINLPQASSALNEIKPKHVSLAIDDNGAMFWNGERIERGALKARLDHLGRTAPETELHLRADKHTQYQALAEVMADAANAGIKKIGFVSEPSSKNNF